MGLDPPRRECQAPKTAQTLRSSGAVRRPGPSCLRLLLRVSRRVRVIGLPQRQRLKGQKIDSDTLRPCRSRRRNDGRDGVGSVNDVLSDPPVHPITRCTVVSSASTTGFERTSVRRQPQDDDARRQLTCHPAHAAPPVRSTLPLLSGAIRTPRGWRRQFRRCGRWRAWRTYVPDQG